MSDSHGWFSIVSKRSIAEAVALLILAVTAGHVINALRIEPVPPPSFDRAARLGHKTELARAAPSSGDFRTIPDLTVNQVVKMLEQKRCLLIDARPPAFFRKEHIPEAINLPLRSFVEPTDAIAGMLGSRREMVLIVYCSGPDCTDSDSVAHALVASNYENIYTMHAGIAGWQGSGLPTVNGP